MRTSNDSDASKQIILGVIANKTTKWTRFKYNHTRYCGGEMDCDIFMDCRFSVDKPQPCSVSLDSKEHKAVPDFQYPMNVCPKCDKKDIYLTRFENRNLQRDGFGYDEVDMAYYCSNCNIEIQVQGKWL
jgi:hypothetical protein